MLLSVSRHNYFARVGGLIKLPVLLGMLLSLSSCAGSYRGPDQLHGELATYQAAVDTSRASRFAPLFLVEENQFPYNRPGTPQLYRSDDDKTAALVNPAQPTLYWQETDFQGRYGTYHNLIYRLHFSEVPPGHLTSGKNVGLLVIVTLDSQERPLLYTLVHTCGCYLAIIPTAHLPKHAFPEGWNTGTGDVYGELLPGLLPLPAQDQPAHLLITLRSETHRAMDIRLVPSRPPSNTTLTLQPMLALHQLPLEGATSSFFENTGARKGYVRNSQKLWEQLFMSWWALDGKVGEDKALGPAQETGVIFYTSLKPWAREASNLWEFHDFLTYWGWDL